MKTNIALTFALLILLFLQFKSCGDSSSFLDTNVLLQTNIKKVTNKLGEETAIKRSLQIENKKLNKNLSKSLAVEKNLRERIKRNTLAGFNTEISTEINEVVIKTDSVIYDSIYPVYLTEDSSKWHVIKIRASKDSTTLERLKIRNEITGVFNEKHHVFKKDSIVLELTNHNPFTTTETMQSFIYSPKKRRLGIGVVGGYGIGPKGSGPYIGVGVSWNFLTF